MTAHRCHARGCKETVAHEKLMCLRHWRMVPKPEADAVWHTYRTYGALTPPWLEATRAAIDAVAQAEQRLERRNSPYYRRGP